VKIVSFRANGRDGVGVVTDGDPETGHAVDATGADPRWTSVLEVLRAGALDDLAAWAHGRRPDIDLAAVDLLPPVPNPGKILCAGVNYAVHRDEANAAPATHPTIFTRFPDSQMGYGSPIVRPTVAENLDFEGELVAVIGRDVYRESPDEAADAVAAWSCYQDGSVRDWQFHSSQWIPGKNFPHTGGFGPWLVTADEVGPVEQLHLTTRVNGEVVQSAPLADLIFTVPQLVSYVSGFTPLRPGDLLVTGTPGGVGAFRTPPLWLRAGDVVTVEIPGVGVLRNPVEDEKGD
jgi:2-keto-4-pentenoate hydratase/2-oxohepta-3-ene-1,7-dioic acid hydratase in catechol pathway